MRVFTGSRGEISSDAHASVSATTLMGDGLASAHADGFEITRRGRREARRQSSLGSSRPAQPVDTEPARSPEPLKPKFFAKIVSKLKHKKKSTPDRTIPSITSTGSSKQDDQTMLEQEPLTVQPILHAPSLEKPLSALPAHGRADNRGSFESDWDVMGGESSSNNHLGTQGLTQSLVAASTVQVMSVLEMVQGGTADPVALDRLARHAANAQPQSWSGTPSIRDGDSTSLPAATPRPPDAGNSSRLQKVTQAAVAQLEQQRSSHHSSVHGQIVALRALQEGSTPLLTVGTTPDIATQPVFAASQGQQPETLDHAQAVSDAPKRAPSVRVQINPVPVQRSIWSGNGDSRTGSPRSPRDLGSGGEGSGGTEEVRKARRKPSLAASLLQDDLAKRVAAIQEQVQAMTDEELLDPRNTKKLQLISSQPSVGEFDSAGYGTRSTGHDSGTLLVQTGSQQLYSRGEDDAGWTTPQQHTPGGAGGLLAASGSFGAQQGGVLVSQGSQGLFSQGTSDLWAASLARAPSSLGVGQRPQAQQHYLSRGVSGAQDPGAAAWSPTTGTQASGVEAIGGVPADAQGGFLAALQQGRLAGGVGVMPSQQQANGYLPYPVSTGSSNGGFMAHMAESGAVIGERAASRWSGIQQVVPLGSDSGAAGQGAFHALPAGLHAMSSDEGLRPSWLPSSTPSPLSTSSGLRLHTSHRGAGSDPLPEGQAGAQTSAPAGTGSRKADLTQAAGGTAKFSITAALTQFAGQQAETPATRAPRVSGVVTTANASNPTAGNSAAPPGSSMAWPSPVAHAPSVLQSPGARPGAAPRAPVVPSSSPVKPRGSLTLDHASLGSGVIVVNSLNSTYYSSVNGHRNAAVSASGAGSGPIHSTARWSNNHIGTSSLTATTMLGMLAARGSTPGPHTGMPSLDNLRQALLSGRAGLPTAPRAAAGTRSPAHRRMSQVSFAEADSAQRQWAQDGEVAAGASANQPRGSEDHSEGGASADGRGSSTSQSKVRRVQSSGLLRLRAVQNRGMQWATEDTLDRPPAVQGPPHGHVSALPGQVFDHDSRLLVLQDASLSLSLPSQGAAIAGGGAPGTGKDGGRQPSPRVTMVSGLAPSGSAATRFSLEAAPAIPTPVPGEPQQHNPKPYRSPSFLKPHERQFLQSGNGLFLQDETESEASQAGQPWVQGDSSSSMGAAEAQGPASVSARLPVHASDPKAVQGAMQGPMRSSARLPPGRNRSQALGSAPPLGQPVRASLSSNGGVADLSPQQTNSLPLSSLRSLQPLQASYPASVQSDPSSRLSTTSPPPHVQALMASLSAMGFDTSTPAGLARVQLALAELARLNPAAVAAGGRTPRLSKSPGGSMHMTWKDSVGAAEAAIGARHRPPTPTSPLNGQQSSSELYSQSQAQTQQRLTDSSADILAETAAYHADLDDDGTPIPATVLDESGQLVVVPPRSVKGGSNQKLLKRTSVTDARSLAGSQRSSTAQSEDRVHPLRQQSYKAGLDKRSLTPSTLSHSRQQSLGDPMLTSTTSNRQGLLMAWDHAASSWLLTETTCTDMQMRRQPQSSGHDHASDCRPSTESNRMLATPGLGGWADPQEPPANPSASGAGFRGPGATTITRYGTVEVGLMVAGGMVLLANALVMLYVVTSMRGLIIGGR